MPDYAGSSTRIPFTMSKHFGLRMVGILLAGYLAALCSRSKRKPQPHAHRTSNEERSMRNKHEK